MSSGANADYAAANTTTTVTISQAVPSLALAYPNSNSVTYSSGGTLDTSTATTTGSATPTYSTSSSACSVNSSTGRITIATAGSCAVLMSSANSTNYSATNTTTTVTINGAISLSGTTNALTTTYGIAAYDTITATLGTGNKTFTLADPSATSGITLNTATTNQAILQVGVGVPHGSYSLTITATDSLGATATYDITLTLNLAAALTVTATSPNSFNFSPNGISLTNSAITTGLIAGDATTSVTYSYALLNTCAMGGSCQIGDIGPGGGKVFYDAGITEAWGRYLEFAPTNWYDASTTVDPSAHWCTGAGSSALVGTYSGLGNGETNTANMVAGCNSGDAGNLAAAYAGGGFHDWYLPNAQEFVEIKSQAASIGFDYQVHSHWVSYEWNEVGAEDDAYGFSYKSIQTAQVHPIRAFDITRTVDQTISSSVPVNAGSYSIIPSAAALASGHESQYAGITYVNGVLTIERIADTGFLDFSTLEAVYDSPFTLVASGGLGTGSISYAISGGTATGCALSGSTLTTTSSGYCTITFTRAQSTNYLSATDTANINFYQYLTQTSNATSGGSSHGVTVTGGGTSWSKIATAAPSITSISASSGPIGTLIRITGVGLDGVTIVQLNFEDMASITGVSSTEITAVVQSGATTGPIYIQNSYGADFNFAGFTVTP